MKSGTLPRIPQKYSDKFSNIINKMLSYRPHDRPEASSLEAEIVDITSRIMLSPGTQIGYEYFYREVRKIGKNTSLVENTIDK